jgi:hypothetical protein
LPIKVEVAKFDLAFEAGFPRPEFALFQNTALLLDRLHRRLERYGVKLTDIRVERGAGSIGDHHILLYLFDYWMTVRVRVDRVEVNCSSLPENLVESFRAAIVDVLQALKECTPDLSFRAFAVAVGIHARLEGQQPRDYLARFVTNTPTNLGPATGSGVIFYFGPEGDRVLAALTADLSTLVPDALFVRVHSVWDAARVGPEALTGLAESFVRQAIDRLGLELAV